MPKFQCWRAWKTTHWRNGKFGHPRVCATEAVTSLLLRTLLTRAGVIHHFSVGGRAEPLAWWGWKPTSRWQSQRLASGNVAPCFLSSGRGNHQWDTPGLTQFPPCLVSSLVPLPFYYSWPRFQMKSKNVRLNENTTWMKLLPPSRRNVLFFPLENFITPSRVEVISSYCCHCPQHLWLIKSCFDSQTKITRCKHEAEPLRFDQRTNTSEKPVDLLLVTLAHGHLPRNHTQINVNNSTYFAREQIRVIEMSPVQLGCFTRNIFYFYANFHSLPSGLDGLMIDFDAGYHPEIDELKKDNANKSIRSFCVRRPFLSPGNHSRKGRGGLMWLIKHSEEGQ